MSLRSKLFALTYDRQMAKTEKAQLGALRQSLLEAARGAGVRRFVFASTGGAIYGEGVDKQLPLTEDTLFTTAP